MDAITDHKILSKKFDEIKDELDEAENSLTKLLGRRRNNFLPTSAEYAVKQGFMKASAFPQSISKRPKLEEPEESSSEEESKKVIRSAVKAKVEKNKSRREIILNQNCNKNIQSRNRRMFGMVQSTLKQFQNEAVKRQSQELKKIEVEQKVEAAKEKEKEMVEKQKRELYSKKREKQLQLQCLQKMMQLTETHEIWENNHMCLLNYIITEAEPKICFLPASHTKRSKIQLDKSQAKIQEIIKNHKASLERELTSITESYQSEVSSDTEYQSFSLKDDSYYVAEEPKEFAEENLHLSEEPIFD